MVYRPNNKKQSLLLPSVTKTLILISKCCLMFRCYTLEQKGSCQCHYGVMSLRIHDTVRLLSGGDVDMDFRWHSNQMPTTLRLRSASYAKSFDFAQDSLLILLVFRRPIHF
jgi:hypothetical protein